MIGAPAGPFRILGIAVLDPRAKDPDSAPAKMAAAVKKRIDAGKTGVGVGEGFCSYI